MPESLQLRAWRRAFLVAMLGVVLCFSSFVAEPPSGQIRNDADFAARCSGPGVIHCYGFDGLVDLTDATGLDLCTGEQCWALDTEIRASGQSALRFEVAANVLADMSGSFHPALGDDLSQQIGVGEDFYVQYRQRFSPAMLGAIQAATGKFAGWKQSIVFAADEWMTFKQHVVVGSWGVHPDNRVRVWAARQGQPSVLIFDSFLSHPEGFPLHHTDATAKFGKVWLLPYLTNKGPAEVHSIGYVWYDELIISRQDIPNPGTLGAIFADGFAAGDLSTWSAVVE